MSCRNAHRPAPADSAVGADLLVRMWIASERRYVSEKLGPDLK